MFVHERFELEERYRSLIRAMTPQFGYNGFGEITYYRSYSRMVLDDSGKFVKQEHWPDTVLRVIDGIMSIRKDWYKKCRIRWDEEYWQRFAYEMGVSMFRMEWLPPGRGLWAMGTRHIYERGAMPLYNCAFTEIGEDWIEELSWFMDTLMHGVGVGFKPVRTDLKLIEPAFTYEFVIPDSREGWVDAMRRLFKAFVDPDAGLPVPKYHLVRPEGSLIKTFGGIASGPKPLKEMLEKMEELLYRYTNSGLMEEYDEVHFKTDLANLIGVCVVTGNVRRSAEIGLCEINDPVFMQLKNYKKYPERAAWGWMSNNSVILRDDEDFERIDEIAQANINGHDVGYINYRNYPYGRVGKFDDVRVDGAIGINPCGEIPLESAEVCNVAETLPTRCVDTNRWLKACGYATFYCSTVSLLPTHQERTNRVVARNRRIGVSIIDFTGWKEQLGTCSIIMALKAGYKEVRRINKELAEEAGVPVSIRVTTMKPGGTVPKMAGRTAGAGYPTFRHTIRRIRIQQNTTLERVLIEAGVPCEPDAYSKMTTTFSYPIIQGPAKPAKEASIWEQAMNVVLLQREWADNAVSNTLYFKPRWSVIERGNMNSLLEIDTSFNLREMYAEKDVHVRGDVRVRFNRETDDFIIERYNPEHEEDDIEAVLSAIAPLTKSVSLLPHSEVGIFKQMPEEGISQEQYEEMLSRIKEINWQEYKGTDGFDEKYCQGEACEIPRK